MFSVSSVLLQALNLFLGIAQGPIRTDDKLSEFPVFSLSASDKVVDDLKRRGYNHILRFIVLPSHKMPRWLVPIDNYSAMLAATRIYLPQKRSAQILRSLFIRMVKMGWDGYLRSRVLVASKDPLPMEQLVRAATGEQCPFFALSLGRMATVRKLTVQIMDQHGNIIAYAKLPLAHLADQRVRNEANTLERLSNFVSLRPHIPRVLYAGKYSDNYMLLQSPLEGEPGPTNCNGMHQQFLQTLWNVHRLTKPGRLLINEVAGRWEKVAPFLGTKWAELGQETLRYSNRALAGVLISFGVMHGDFAPWNTRVRRDDLLLFDWESAQWEAPTSWDMFHFRVQAASSFKRQESDRISELRSPDDVLFMLYLLDSVGQFLEEGNLCAIRERQALLTKQLYKSRQMFGETRSAGCVSVA